MKYDTREGKLPKWAQDVLADARMRGDLAWPTEAKPEPYCIADANGFTQGGDPRGMALWSHRGGYNGREVEQNRFDERGYIQPEHGGFATRPNGAFYLTEREAILAAWWKEAADAAKRLHRVAQMAREATE